MEIEIDASQLLRLAAALTGTAPLLDAELMTAGVRSTAQIQADVMAASPVWRGTARRSVTTQAAPRQWKVGTNVLHAKIVQETGRRAGAAMPPVGALLAWMSSKGIPEDREYVIRRAISRKGIPARHLYTNALRTHEGAIRAEFDAALARFAAKLASRI